MQLFTTSQGRKFNLELVNGVAEREIKLRPPDIHVNQIQKCLLALWLLPNLFSLPSYFDTLFVTPQLRNNISCNDSLRQHYIIDDFASLHCSR